MSNFEGTMDDVENRLLDNPEDTSFLVVTIIELENLIKINIDVINRGRSNSLKNILK